jgi:hypothetical protein
MLGGTRLSNGMVGTGLDRDRERERLMRNMLEAEQRRSGINSSPVPSV